MEKYFTTHHNHKDCEWKQQNQMQRLYILKYSCTWVTFLPLPNLLFSLCVKKNMMSSAIKPKGKQFLLICFSSLRWTTHTWVVLSLRIKELESEPDNSSAGCFCQVWATCTSLLFSPHDMNNSVVMAYHWLRAKCTLWLEPLYTHMSQLVSELDRCSGKNICLENKDYYLETL